MTLDVLLLAGAHDEVARAMAALLSPRHRPELLLGGGLFAGLTATKAARGIGAHLVHSIGVEGFAGSAGAVAAGLGVPWIAQLLPEDLAPRRRRRAIRAAERAHAVLAADQTVVEAIRAAGVTRDLYVLSPPTSPEDGPPVLGAVEVVYGRALADTELEPDPAPPVEAPLVQLPRRG